MKVTSGPIATATDCVVEKNVCDIVYTYVQETSVTRQHNELWSTSLWASGGGCLIVGVMVGASFVHEHIAAPTRPLEGGGASSQS